MSDVLENRQSASASTKSEPPARPCQEMNAFLKLLFGRASHLEESFQRVCDAGCSQEEFGLMLGYQLMVWGVRGLCPRGQERLADLPNISKRQLKGLPNKIQDMADTIESLNGTIYAPAHDIKLAPYDAEREIAREYLIRQYEILPGVLRVYAVELERFSKLTARLLKRLTLDQVDAVRLVRYVEDHTGSPHYEDVSILLEAVWRMARKTEARFLSTDGITKLYQRWAKSVCGPSHAPQSRLRSTF
jgi:hypothetical protein